MAAFQLRDQGRNPSPSSSGAEPFIPRRVVLPFAIAIVTATTLTALTTSVGLFLQYHNAEWIVKDHPPLPLLAEFLRSIYPGIWLLPFLSIAFAIHLLHRDLISLPLLSWFIAVSHLLIFLRFLFIGIAMYGIYVQHNHYMMPIEAKG